MTTSNQKSQCTCGGLEQMAQDPKDPVEFDAQLNEFHITRKGNGGYSVIQFCPWCGGKAPKSLRSSLFHKLTAAERHRLGELTKDLQTVQDVVAALGEPDVKGLTMSVITPEKEGVPETTQNYPVMTYSKLSDIANVLVQVYPTGKVGITFQGKPMLVQQTHEVHFSPGPKAPEPEPQIDTGKRYDVYCIEPNRETVVYRNALFKAVGRLLPSPGGRMAYPDFVELEQANGQSIFISRGSIFRFCAPGTAVVAEPVTQK